MLISKPQLYESSMSRNLHNHANHPHPPSYPDHQLQHRGHVSHASKHGGASKFGMASTHGQNSTMGNADSMLNFYPHLLQPTRMSEAVGAGSSNASSNRSPSTRMSLKNAATLSTAKTVSFYRSGDVHMQAFKVAITKRHFRTFDSLLEALSDRIPLPFGVRTVSTPNGTHGISRLDEFEDGKSYVCSDKKTVKPLNLNAVRSTRPPWFISKPRTRNRVVAQLVRPADSESFRVPLRLTQVKTPKKIVIVRNGDPSFRHTLLLSRRTPQSFESIMEDIGEIFRMRAHKLFTTDGRRVDSLQSLFLGPNVYVAAGREAFQPMEYRMKKVAITDEKRDPLTGEMDLIKERFPKELKKTKGKWRVTVATSELPAAGTDSRVMINVYGVKGNSGPILLSDGNKSTFRSGNEDDFVIHVGSIGDIRKIRIAHDNSGTSPGWLCDSVTLTDVTTGDKLDFHCNKWLSRDEDDGEICREIAAHLPEKPVLPEITYVVSVTTGNLWNAGTDAEVLLTLYGELGDCGPRLLQHGGKSQPQVKGTTDVFRMRAVTLGNLFRVVVGHDCQDSGGGWFLERITVKEDRVGSEEWIFECNRWLDAGEDDQKTVRELYSEPDAKIMQPSRGKSQAEKLKDDMWWDLEKWKFQRGNQVVLMNHATLKAVRVRSDAGIDALGDPSHPQCAFEVLRRRSNVRVFSNVVQPSFHIALDQNRMLGQGKGGTFCEFHVKVQRDRSVLLESCKYAGQHATFDPSGKAADTRGNANIPGRTFTVYVKGCFRHDSLVMLNTSPTQALAVASSGDVIGTGRRSEVDIVGSKRSGNETRLPRQLALFRVVKVAEGVRMFQCEEDRRKFLRIKDGQCDGLGSGDVYCHFKVQKYKIGGYVTLQSMKNRGVFVGLNTNGRARPTVDTGNANTQFFPEVVKFGVRRTAKADQWITPEPSFVMSAREAPSSQRIVSPEKPKPSPTQVTLKEREDSNTGPKDGDYRVYVTTGSSGSIETVTLFVYGDRGQSDAIILGKGTEGGVFQCGQTDEFQVNLTTVGAVRKIRIGMEECSPDCDWRLKQVKMKDMTSNEILRFKFNRWLSRTRDDGATVRELPATAQDGSPTLPVMRYLVMVRTGKSSPPPSSKSNKPPPRSELGDIPEPEVYLCVYGENYDTGRRLLIRRPPQTPESGRESQKPLFASGQVDRFEIEAVSLGELTKCVISCPKTSQRTAPPTPWLCDEIVIRESDGASSEFVFPCKKWLGARKPKAKTQISINLGEKREVKRKQSESTEHEVGDWKVSVTTGTQENAGTSANVMFVAYSSDGTSSGPVLLGSGANGLFERGTTERFKVNLIKLDDLYKIRLSQDASGAHPSWYVERVKLKDMSSDVTYTLEVNKWISMYEEPHQMAAEIPIPKPGEELSPVNMYKVLVYTGGILGSDTEANVFISIHGTKGDTGRRPLHRSLNHDVKFQESQIDIFEVEAVDLGDLLKIEIGHDGVGPGNGWFLHKVIIKESDISQKDYIFFLNRWLDDGQDDGKIERIIEVEPPDFSEPQDTTTEGEYKVYITTGSQSSDEPCPSDTLVSMVIYGDDGKTGQILLQPAPSRQSERADSPGQANLFQPGQTDEFKIEVPEIGSIYKVRISINEECDWRGIFLDRILLVKSSSKRETLFVCNRWLSAVEDDQETVREFPVTTEGEQQLPVHPYFVTVTTGDRPAGDTDANVFVTLRGERGDTGRRRLNQLRPDAHTFQRGKATSFTLEAVDLGRLQEIVVSHDGKGYGSGWFLERITVREQEFAALEWLFPCRMWLDDHVGDCKTIRRLALLGTCEVATGEEELIKLRAPPSSGESLADAEANLYAVAVSVGEVMTQGNDAVTLRGYVEGAEGNAGPFSLGEWIPGREKEFEADVKMEGVGEINKLRVEMQESDRDLNLYLLDVTVRDHRTNDVLSFSFHRRFRTSTGCTVRELPALRSNREYQNLVTYAVSVDMSPSNEDVGADGNLSLMLTGEAGTSGYRTLFRRTDGFKATKREKGYTFEMTAVDLGRLTAASIVYTTDESSASEGGWNVEAISVKVPDLPNFFAGECKPEPTYSATVRHEFTSIAGVSRVEKEYRLDEFEAGRELNRTFRKASAARPRRNVKSPDVPSTGEWSLSLTAAKYNENSIFNRISARVFGTRGCSDVIDVSHDVTRERVSQYDNPELTTRAVDVKLAEELGQLYMIRLTISKESDVRIYKVKLKDNATEQEYLSHITAQQRLHAEADDAGCLCFDLPLLRPDEEPLTHQKYDVCVKTGTHPASCTGADVRLNLVGATSETGFRPLAALCDDPDTLYGLGQMDRFAIETADVGEPRKVVVAHDGAGRGAGWFLDDVTVSQRCAGVDSDFRFFFNKWLDDSVDDKLTEREANVAATRILQPEVDASTLKGKWKCELISREELVKQKSYDVRICYCFAGGRTRDVVRQVTKATEDFDVILIEEQTESQDGDLDAQPEEEEEEEEVFVKIRAEVESSNEAIRKRWPLEEMLMSNQSTQEKLRFLFDDVPTWEGSLRGHVRELPVWRSNQTPLPVVEYYVVFNTSNDSSPDSRPGLVTIQLQGKGGATGWRKIVTPENAENRFQPGRIDVFTIEAVDLGDSVECVSVNVGGPLDQPWSLEKVKVKRGFYADQEQIFECAREIREDEVVDLTDPRMSSCAPVPSLRKSAMTAVANATYEVALLWSGLEESLARKEDSPGGSREALPPVHVQLVGSKGLRDLASLDLSEAKQGKRKRWTSNVKVEVVAAKFGDLRKIGIGFLEVVDPRHSALKLHKLEIVNLQNNDHYSFRPDHSFVGEGSERETGLNWMELVAVLPRQDSNSILNIVDYHVTIRTTDRESAGTDADVYVTLAGSNGDSGKRWMMRTLDGETPSFTPGASDMFKITSVDLGTLKEITIGRNGRQTSAGWHLADVTVTSSLDPDKKLFLCGQWLSNLESESFIERVLKLRETPESPLEDAVLS